MAGVLLPYTYESHQLCLRCTVYSGIIVLGVLGTDDCRLPILQYSSLHHAHPDCFGMTSFSSLTDLMGLLGHTDILSAHSVSVEIEEDNAERHFEFPGRYLFPGNSALLPRDILFKARFWCSS